MSTSARSATTATPHSSRCTATGSSAPVRSETAATTWSATATVTGPSTSSHQANLAATLAKSTTLDSQSAVDHYTQRVLVQAAHEAQRSEKPTSNDDDDDAKDGTVQGILIDESLGPYVTSCLRTAKSSDSTTVTDVTELLEFDCLCELIQEHCQIEHRTAVVPIIQRIATAVFSGVVPDIDDAIPTNAAVRPSPSSTPSEIAALSLSSNNAVTATETRPHSNQRDEASAQGSQFVPPPSNTAPLNNSSVSQSSSYRGQPSSVKDAPTQAIAPIRQQSIAADHYLPVQYSASTSTAAASSSSVPLDESEPPFDPDLYHQQIVAHYMQTIHTDVSDDAAWEATSMAQGHWNVASHLIECASNQLPLCRNLLTHGCYRADCSFSHDRERHTCLFWLRSKCTKRADCTFRHGFDPDHLTTAPEPDVTSFYDPTSYDMYDPNDYHDVNGNDSSRMDRNTLHSNQPKSLWIPNPPPMQTKIDVRTSQFVSATSSSFANIASHGYAPTSFPNHSSAVASRTTPTTTVRIPQSLWNPHEQRCDANAFYIADPLERYRTVNAQRKKEDNVIDLHYQSLQTFAVVLDSILPTKLTRYESVWIITGTGHSVRTQTHQKGGGTLEAAVWEYLVTYYCGVDDISVQQGRDRNGQGGAIFVQRKHSSTATR